MGSGRSIPKPETLAKPRRGCRTAFGRVTPRPKIVVILVCENNNRLPLPLGTEPSASLRRPLAVFATMGYSFVMTFVLLKVLDKVMGLRVSLDEELAGLDASQHGERAYTSDESGVPVGVGTILPAPPVAYAAQLPGAVPAQGH